MGIIQKKSETKGIYEGPILGTLFKLAAPVFVGMFFQPLYSIIDTIWISRIDLNNPSYVGGLWIVLPLVFLTIAISSGILVGVGSLIARATGKKDYEPVNSAAESGFILSSALFQAIAMPMSGLIITLIRLIAISVPLAHLLVLVVNMGMYDIWIGIISGAINFLMFTVFIADAILGGIAKLTGRYPVFDLRRAKDLRYRFWSYDVENFLQIQGI